MIQTAMAYDAAVSRPVAEVLKEVSSFPEDSSYLQEREIKQIRKRYQRMYAWHCVQ